MIPLRQLIKAIFKIGNLVSSNDSGNFQTGIFKYMGSTPRGQIFIPYGDLSRAPDGSQMAVFAQNGNQSNVIAFASDPKNRTIKNLKSGEKGIANYVTGSHILLTENGDVIVVSKNDLKVTAGTSSFEIKQNGDILAVSGNDFKVTAGSTSFEMKKDGDFTFTAGTNVFVIKKDGGILNNGVDIGKDHSHPQGNDSAGNTEQNTGTVI